MGVATMIAQGLLPSWATGEGNANEGLKDLQERQEAENAGNAGNSGYGTIPKDYEDTEEQINGVSLADYATWAEKWQKAQWEREDVLRKEQQERDDNAYSRMVADMEKAGINPNLVQGTPNYGTNAQQTQATDSGMGANATQASSLLNTLTSKYNTELQTAISKYNTDMQKAIASNANDTQKDNITMNFIGTIISLIAKAMVG